MGAWSKWCKYEHVNETQEVSVHIRGRERREGGREAGREGEKEGNGREGRGEGREGSGGEEGR